MRGMIVELIVVEEYCVVRVIELEQMFQAAGALVRTILDIVDLN